MCNKTYDTVNKDSPVGLVVRQNQDWIDHGPDVMYSTLQDAVEKYVLSPTNLVIVEYFVEGWWPCKRYGRRLFLNAQTKTSNTKVEPNRWE
jgi:hypothetical protein